MVWEGTAGFTRPPLSRSQQGTQTENSRGKMKLKIFTLRLNPSTGLFDEGELAKFQLGKDVIDVSEHFLVHEKTPTLLLVLRYRELPDNGGGTRSSPEAARKDWRAELDAPGQKIYDEFRLWRGRKAKHDGLPPYLILNNRELAELVMKRPANISQLREIEGIGEAKAKRWGEEMLAILEKLKSSKLPETLPSDPRNDEAGGGVAHGFRRASSFRPLGKNTQRYFFSNREVPQAGPLYLFLADRQFSARHSREDRRSALRQG